MDTEAYKGIERELIDKAKEIADAKRPAYTMGSPDVLANFKRIAERTGLTPGQVLSVYMLKHVDAVTAALCHPALPQAEKLEGRFADLLNYVILGRALLREAELEINIAPWAKKIGFGQAIDRQQTSDRQDAIDTLARGIAYENCSPRG